MSSLSTGAMGAVPGRGSSLGATQIAFAHASEPLPSWRGSDVGLWFLYDSYLVHAIFPSFEASHAHI